MVYAFDTYYYPEYANTVCIAFENWTSEKESEVFVEQTGIDSGYESGAFYKRELPCIQSLLKKIVLKPGDMALLKMNLLCRTPTGELCFVVKVKPRCL